MKMNISNLREELELYYDDVLNLDKSTYKNSNDEPTPIDCVKEMVKKIPLEFWEKKELKILDPCCGNGNLFLPIYNNLLQKYDKKYILEEILYFNDINEERLKNVSKIYMRDIYNLNITNEDFLLKSYIFKFDLIIINPPYAKFLDDGKRASKNHNLIKDWTKKALSLLKPNGYLVMITPDNWMSYANRNDLIQVITSLQIIHLNIHTAKKYFKKIGSSFTWYIIENCPFYKEINITGIWKKQIYNATVSSQVRKYIPLLYDQIVQNILMKTIDSSLQKFKVETSSDLHHYTKKEYISKEKSAKFPYKLIHTPKQIVYSSRPHKYQDGYKVFISTTDTYNVFIDNCGMTQSIAFIRCKNLEEAEVIRCKLEHSLYVFLNNICRWGNFNNIRILQSFPVFDCEISGIYNFFGITREEEEYIKNHI